MLTLIRNVDLYAPQPRGRMDLLLAGDRVLAMGADLAPQGVPLQVLEGNGRRLVPGFVDALTHPAGGGGEGGFGNRTSEIAAEDFLAAGITSPIGALGTDSLGRSLDVLYAQTMSLRAAGLNALMYVGSYRIPAPSLTGDVARDLLFIEPVIGVGEVAVADHRGSQPTREELTRLAADVALGGTLSGKGGTVMIHLGDGAGAYALLNEVLDHSELPAALFLPTHVNRKHALLDDAAAFTRRGGYADVTVATTPELIAAGDVSALDALQYLLDAGAERTRLTLSSDAGGSLPDYRDGVLHGLQEASPGVMADLVAEAAAAGDDTFQLVLEAMTINPAQALGLNERGSIEVGQFADFLVLDDVSSRPSHVFCAGRCLLGQDELLTR